MLRRTGRGKRQRLQGCSLETAVRWKGARGPYGLRARRDVKCRAYRRTGARMGLRAKRFLLIFAVFDTTITRIFGVQDRRTEIGPHSGIEGHFP